MARGRAVKRVAGVAVLAASTLFAASMVVDHAAATSPVTVESNLCYQTSHKICVDGVSHEFDAYLPAAATQKTPAVVLIHGGGFTAGDKSDFANIGKELAAQGLAAFSINYRLDSSTIVGFPMESQDVMTAISYVRSHASKFNVDPSRLASFGGSAGATLAVYTALEAAQNDPSAQVLADVGWSGGYDFTVGASGAVDPTQLKNVENYLGCDDLTDPTCEATESAASAVSLIQAHDPPSLLANSTDYKVGCEIVDPAQAQEMAADLTKAGDPVQLDLNSECAHANAYANIELGPTITFLEAHLFVAPTIQSRSSKAFRVGTSSTFTVKSRANPTSTLTESGALPAGITFVDQGDGHATLGGSAEAGTEGTYPIVITAANGGLPNAVQDFDLSVTPPRK